MEDRSSKRGMTHAGTCEIDIRPIYKTVPRWRLAQVAWDLQRLDLFPMSATYPQARTIVVQSPTCIEDVEL